MVKIKTKKTMTEKEYLHFLVDKADFENISHDYLHVNDEVTHAEVTLSLFDRYNKTDSVCYVDKDYKLMFKVNTEEDITEDTVIPKLMTTFKKTCLKGGIGYQRVRIDENYSIKLMLNRAEEHKEPIETLHVVNDDGTHTLIWREGKLVE